MKNLAKIKLIFGLGNPGYEFINTPHNFGRDLLVPFINKKSIFKNKNFQLSVYKNIYLAISTRYMNESGEVLGEILNKLKLTTQETLIIHDEADLPFLCIKLTFNRKSAMHKGVESIYKKCGKKIWRLRIGIQNKQRQKAEEIILKKLKGENLSKWSKTKEKFSNLLDILSNKEISKISLPKLYFLNIT